MIAILLTLFSINFRALEVKIIAFVHQIAVQITCKNSEKFKKDENARTIGVYGFKVFDSPYSIIMAVQKLFPWFYRP